MREINGKIMMSQSDIEKEYHIKRSKLREYEAKKLIEPSAYTHYGTMQNLWYDEATVFKLQEICMYRELGIPLNEIKKLFDDPSISRLDVLDNLILKLEARKREIEKQIEFCKYAKNAGPTMLAPVSSLEGGIIGFMNQLEPMMKRGNVLLERIKSGENPDDKVQISKFMAALERLKALRELPIESGKICAALKDIVSYLTWLHCRISEIEETSSTFLHCYVSATIILQLLGSGEFYEMIEQECGAGGANFLAEGLFYNAVCEIDSATTQIRSRLRNCISDYERESIYLEAYRTFCEDWNKYIPSSFPCGDDELMVLLRQSLDFDDGDLTDPQEIKNVFSEIAADIKSITHQNIPAK